MSWVENLKEVRKQRGVTNKWIAEHSGVPEKSVDRIFQGKTESPKVDTLRPICNALDVSLDDILADTCAFIGNKTTATLQGEVNNLVCELERINAEYAILTAEIAMLKEKNASLTSEINILQLKLDHKEELLALHNYYIKMKSND